MSADRKAAASIGVLYIIGTVVLILSGVVTSGVPTGHAYLAQVAAHRDRPRPTRANYPLTGAQGREYYSLNRFSRSM